MENKKEERIKKCTSCNHEKKISDFPQYKYAVKTGKNIGKKRVGYRSLCKVCTKYRMNSRYSGKYRENNGFYTVYVLPRENPIYCGITKQLNKRLWYHKTQLKRNIDDARILGTFNSKNEALYHEAWYQGYMAFGGLSMNGEKGKASQ